MKNEKPILTVPELIDLLKARGLIITQADEQLLKEINYYVLINGYKKPFLQSNQNERYHIGTTLREIYALYQFDVRLRQILLPLLIALENYLKSIINRTFTEHLKATYGNDKDCYKESFYLQPQLYAKPLSKHNIDIIEKALEAIRKPLKKDPKQLKTDGAKHYKKNHGYIPLWVLMPELSFGNLSYFFNILPICVKQACHGELYRTAQEKSNLSPQEKPNLSPQEKRNLKQIERRIHTFSLLRNACAHANGLYSKRFNNTNLDAMIKSLLEILNQSQTLKDEAAPALAACQEAAQTLKNALSKENWHHVKRQDNALFTYLLTADSAK